MGSNLLNDSGVMEIAKNIMIMSIFALFIIMIFVVLVHFFAKRRQQAITDSNNRACEQRGLDDSFLKTIPVIQFDPESFKEGLECAVCLSEVKEGEKARVLPKCDHGFHMECIDIWFHSHSTCPICRNPIIDQSEEISVEQQESTIVLSEGNEANNHHQDSSSEQASSSSSLQTYKNRGRADLVIDIPPKEGNEEEDEKTPVSCSGMRSLTRILSGSRRFNPLSPGSGTGTGTS